MITMSNDVVEEGGSGSDSVSKIRELRSILEATDELKEYKEVLICIIPHVDLIKDLYQEWIRLPIQYQRDTKARFLVQIIKTPQPSSVTLKPIRLAYYLIRAFEYWTNMQDHQGACGVDEGFVKLNHYQENELYQAVSLLQEGMSRAQGRPPPIIPPKPKPTVRPLYLGYQNFISARLALMENYRLHEELSPEHFMSLHRNKQRFSRPVPVPCPETVTEEEDGGSGDNLLSSLRDSVHKDANSAAEILTQRSNSKRPRSSPSESSSSSSETSVLASTVGGREGDEESGNESGGGDGERKLLDRSKILFRSEPDWLGQD